VERVIESSGDAAIVISEADDSNAVSVIRKGQSISLFVASRVSTKAKVESFLLKYAIKSMDNAPSATAGTGDGLCQLEFTLGTDQKANSELIQSLFRDLFGVDPKTTLKFTEIDLQKRVAD